MRNFSKTGNVGGGEEEKRLVLQATRKRRRKNEERRWFAAMNRSISNWGWKGKSRKGDGQVEEEQMAGRGQGEYGGGNRGWLVEDEGESWESRTQVMLGGIRNR